MTMTNTIQGGVSAQQVAGYSKGFSLTIKELFAFLKTNPGTEIQIGDLTITEKNGKLIITDSKGNTKSLEDLVKEMAKELRGLDRVAVLNKVVKKLSSQNGSLKNKRTNLVLLSKEVISNKISLENAIKAKGVLSDTLAATKKEIVAKVEAFKGAVTEFLQELPIPFIFKFKIATKKPTRPFPESDRPSKSTATDTFSTQEKIKILLRVCDIDYKKFTDNKKMIKLGKAQGNMHLHLFHAIDNEGIAGIKEGNKVLTQDELEKIVELITRYANVYDLSFEEAAKLYNGKLKNEDLDAMEKAKDKIVSWLEGKDISSEPKLREALRIHCDSEVLDALVAIIKFNNSGNYNQEITKQTIATYLVRIPEFLRLQNNGNRKVLEGIFGIEYANVKGLNPYPAEVEYTEEKLLGWLRGKEVEKEEEVASDDEITTEEKRKLNHLSSKGNTTELIEYLERLERKYPGNLLIKDMLAEGYTKKEKYEKALIRASFVFEKDATSDRRKRLLGIAFLWQTKVADKELSGKQKTLAEKVYGQIKAMADGESKGRVRDPLEKLAQDFAKLEEGHFRGELEFQKAFADGVPSQLYTALETYIASVKTAIEGLEKENNLDQEGKNKLRQHYEKLFGLYQAKADYKKCLKIAESIITLMEKKKIDGEIKRNNDGKVVFRGLKEWGEIKGTFSKQLKTPKFFRSIEEISTKFEGLMKVIFDAQEAKDKKLKEKAAFKAMELLVLLKKFEQWKTLRKKLEGKHGKAIKKLEWPDISGKIRNYEKASAYVDSLFKEVLGGIK